MATKLNSPEFTPDILEQPSSAQMFLLAKIAICLAKNQGKFIGSRKKENARFFMPQDIEEFDVSHNNAFRHTSQKFFGRVARFGYGRDRQWSMHVVERLWVVEEDQKDSLRSIYKFGWNNDSVSLAAKEVAFASEEAIGCDYLPETVDVRMFEPDYLNAVNECQKITYADCGELISAVMAFSDTSVDRAFSVINK